MDLAPAPPRPDSAATRALLDRAAGGDPAAVDQLLARHRPTLARFVAHHLDPRAAARVDPSDVVQEAQADLARRLPDFLARRPMPFHLWARKTAYDRLLDAHRRHLRRARRAVGREAPWPSASSLAVARPLLARGPSPSQEAEAKEFARRVAAAVANLTPANREVLMLRHADGLPFEEIGTLLGIDPAAARKRFGRALIRLQKALTAAGLLEDLP
jgi:RNA polymerase sigma-70 factor (ECF subfamily)